MRSDAGSGELLSRLEDMCALAEKRVRPVFSAFLNESEQFMAQKFFGKRRGVVFSFWGGDEACVRKMLCVMPDDGYTEEAPREDFPVYALTLSYRRADKPAHRDMLGSFMALGIERQTVGDIFVGDGAAVVFCTKTARDMIYDNISRVGKVGVTISDGVSQQGREAVRPPEFREISVNVASMRADCLVSAVSGLSREKSAEFIRSGSFMLNFEECDNVSRSVSDGDVLTLRGYGKFIVSGDAVTTKKGRNRITLKQYK